MEEDFEGDKSGEDFVSFMMRQLFESMKVVGAVRLNRCLVCNVYANPREHKCSTAKVLELDY